MLELHLAKWLLSREPSEEANSTLYWNRGKDELMKTQDKENKEF